VRIEPELWVDPASRAVDFYVSAFDAKVVHLVGEGDDIVARLSVGDTAFWVAPSSDVMKRFSPRDMGGATGRNLLIVDDPAAVLRRAVEAGAIETSPVAEEHGWRVGRIIDPFGHEWEIGAPALVLDGPDPIEGHRSLG
jgi:PhnB protein